MSCAWRCARCRFGTVVTGRALLAEGHGFPHAHVSQILWMTGGRFLGSGCWFSTHVFPEKKRGFHHPNWWTHIFQRGGEKPPTRDNSHVKWGYPYIIHFNGVFHCKPSSYGGTTIYGNPHMDLISEQSNSSTFCWWSWLDPAKVSKLPVVCRDLRLQKAFRSIVATPQKWGCPPIFLPIDPFLAGKKKKTTTQKWGLQPFFHHFVPCSTRTSPRAFCPSSSPRSVSQVAYHDGAPGPRGHHGLERSLGRLSEKTMWPCDIAMDIWLIRDISHEIWGLTIQYRDYMGFYWG